MPRKCSWNELKCLANDLRRELGTISSLVPMQISFRSLNAENTRIYFLVNTPDSWGVPLLYVDLALGAGSPPEGRLVHHLLPLVLLGTSLSGVTSPASVHSRPAWRLCTNVVLLINLLTPTFKIETSFEIAVVLGDQIWRIPRYNFPNFLLLVPLSATIWCHSTASW